jgi:hypothetical protein
MLRRDQKLAWLNKMRPEAQQIVRLLTNWPGTYVSYAEISRKVDRKRFEKEGIWARQILRSMTEEGILENDGGSGYRLVTAEEPKQAEASR